MATTASPGPTTEASDSVAQFGATIPGLTAADLKLNLKDFTCEGPTLFLDGIDYVCQDERSPTVDYRVEIIGMSPTDIVNIEATFFWYGDKAEMDAEADKFLGYIATLPYDGAVPEDARAWVTSHESGSTMFGPATYSFQVPSTDFVRILDIAGTR